MFPVQLVDSYLILTLSFAKEDSKMDILGGIERRDVRVDGSDTKPERQPVFV